MLRQKKEWHHGVPFCRKSFVIFFEIEREASNSQVTNNREHSSDISLVQWIFSRQWKRRVKWKGQKDDVLTKYTRTIFLTSVSHNWGVFPLWSRGGHDEYKLFPLWGGGMKDNGVSGQCVCQSPYSMVGEYQKEKGKIQCIDQKYIPVHLFLPTIVLIWCVYLFPRYGKKDPI